MVGFQVLVGGVIESVAIKLKRGFKFNHADLIVVVG